MVHFEKTVIYADDKRRGGKQHSPARASKPRPFPPPAMRTNVRPL
jgi:hypothetical protein